MGAGAWTGCGGDVRDYIALVVCSLATLTGCAPEVPVEDNIIIDIQDSRFVQWELEDVFAHFERLWSLRIAEAPAAFYSADDGFYIRDARGVLQNIVEECRLGEAIFQHQNHGFASLHIDDLNLSERKIACIRHLERRGLSLEMPQHILVLEHLRSKGILPPPDH